MKASFRLGFALAMVSACHGGHASHGHRHELPGAAEASAHDALAEVAIAIPIAPGKTQAWRDALADLLGPRYQEYDASRRRYGLTSQTTFLQRTPMGDLALIHMTGPDVRATFHAMSTSQDSWDVRWRDLTMNLHGMDFAKGERVFPKIEAAYSMSSDDLVGTVPYMFAAPVSDEGMTQLRAITHQVMGARHADYVRARLQIGVRREVVSLESSMMGNVVVFYWRAADPVSSVRQLATSSDPFDVWLRGVAQGAHPVELETLTRIVSANVLIGEYPAVTPAR
jgi:hypothetical protein